MEAIVKKFVVGEPVLFCNMYGDTYSAGKLFRWGEVLAGFILKVEEIQARNGALYTVGTIDSVDRTKVHTRLLGSHLIFNLREKAQAEAAIAQYCEEY